MAENDGSTTGWASALGRADRWVRSSPPATRLTLLAVAVGVVLLAAVALGGGGSDERGDPVASPSARTVYDAVDACTVEVTAVIESSGQVADTYGRPQAGLDYLYDALPPSPLTTFQLQTAAAWLGLRSERGEAVATEFLNGTVGRACAARSAEFGY